MRRQCARPGCSAIATATFTFDACARTVWLDPPADGAARAGELCERHARVLTPPQGWRLDDRRTTGSEAHEPPRDGADTLSELRRMLDARTPLLARAFEAAGPV